MAATPEEIALSVISQMVALRRGGVKSALAGGYAVWAPGGPEPAPDLDVAKARYRANEIFDLQVSENISRL